MYMGKQRLWYLAKNHQFKDFQEGELGFEPRQAIEPKVTFFKGWNKNSNPGSLPPMFTFLTTTILNRQSL